MDAQIIQSLGLNESQATTYLYLLKHGKQTPSEVSKGTGETRTNVYNLLDKLISTGLAEKLASERSTYRAKPPTVLKQLLIRRTQEVNRVNAELASILPSLLATYRITHNQPGVVQTEGHEAFKIIYDDVIRSHETPLIFASSNDRQDPETASIIDEQIERQDKAAIESKVLIPIGTVAVETSGAVPKGVTIRENLRRSLPAQVMIYGDNVAFTTFTSGVSSTVISNPEIAATMRAIFEQIWYQA